MAAVRRQAPFGAKPLSPSNAGIYQKAGGDSPDAVRAVLCSILRCELILLHIEP